MDIRLNTFLAVCGTMNYSRAAEELHMTQPAVSQHIQFLEREYGCRLFRYEKRVLQKTKEGAALERFARSLRYNERQLKAEFAQGDGQPVLRIGATKTIGEYAAGRPLAAFLAGGGRASLLVDNTDHLLRLLNNGELDCALLEGFFDKTDYFHICFRPEPFVGICASGHRFAGKVVDWEEILPEPLILREPGSGTRDIFLQMLRSGNTALSRFRQVIEISCFSVIRELAAEGIGITFAYRAVAEGDGRLSVFRLAGAPEAPGFHYVTLRDAKVPDNFLRLL